MNNLKSQIDRISMVLIQSKRFYHEDMPSWPEVLGIYGICLPSRGHNIDWVMPYKIGIFHRTEIRYFHNVKIFLIPFTKKSNKFLVFFSFLLYQFRLGLLLLKSVNRNRYNVFQVRDDALAGLLVVMLKFIFRVKVTINCSFSFYKEEYEAYRNGFGSYLSLFYSKIMYILLIKIVLHYSDFVFPISWNMITELEKQGISKSKMYPLSLGIEPDIFKVKPSKVSFLSKK